MKGLPRILPLAAVAAVGVLVINALENGPGIVGAARALAENVGKPAHKGKAASPTPSDTNAAAPTPADAASAPASAVVAAKPAPVCAPSPTELAQEAGLSPAELQVLQSLGARRGELDRREQGLDTQVSLIAAAEAKVDARIATMNAMKADMQTLIGQLDDKQQAQVDTLVKIYEAMVNSKAQDAADRFVLLSDDVRLPIAERMKPKSLSAMLAKMSPPEAKRLTESLAARYVAQANAARQAINPSPAAAATPAAPPAKPAQLAQAGTAAALAAPAAAPAAPAKPVHHHPRVHSPDAATASATPPAAPATASAAGPAKPQLSAQAAAPPSPAAPAAPSVTSVAPPAAKPAPASGAAATPAPAAPPAKSG